MFQNCIRVEDWDSCLGFRVVVTLGFSAVVTLGFRYSGFGYRHIDRLVWLNALFFKAKALQ